MFNKKEYDKLYRQIHKKEKNKYLKQWQKDNPEKVKAQKKRNYKIHKKEIAKYNKQWNFNNSKYYKQWRKENPKYMRIWEKQRRATNPQYKLSSNMASAIRGALKGKKAGRHWDDLVGYTLKDLIIHLEARFDKNMNWNNQGFYWEIDHIKPQNLFNYTTAKDPEFRKCWALSNLQPLEAIENKKKSKKYYIK